jgi:ribonuclease BN (tRNA processing enzyme)
VGLKLTVLGCCGSYPGPGGACSGYLLDADGTRIWLDAGSGTLANLQRHISLHDIDAVVLSHEHPDHWADVEGLRVACAYVINRHGVPVYAPAGLRRLTYDFKHVMDWQVVEGGDAIEVGAARLTFSRTDHGPETLAVRVDAGGRSLAYSADTGNGWSLEALGPAVDLALVEATLPNDREGDAPGHLSARQAGAMAQQAGARRLVITHLWPHLDPEEMRVDASAAYGAEAEVATMHEEYVI